jgi:hypothetical protein
MAELYIYIYIYVYEPSPQNNLRIPEPIIMKLGLYILPPEPITPAYFINLSYPSVCLYVYPSYNC